jgi:S1-C subfamily serine protease
MITANVIHRTFQIGYKSRSGTAFAIDVDGRHYLVTARHVIEPFDGTGAIEIFANDAWQPIAVTLVAHGKDGIDVSILAPERELAPKNLPVTVASTGLVYGQDVFFLGFPYGVLSKLKHGPGGYPLPLVKKGIMSAFAGHEYLIDAHGNSGFSGGPLVFAPAHIGMAQTIAGVVTDVTTVREPVLKDGEPSGLEFEENTGIMTTVGIEVVLELIRGNPIGQLIV